MEIVIAPKLQPFLEHKLKTGEFASTSEVINYALDRLREYGERLAWMKAEVQQGVDSLDRGEGNAWDLEDTKARLMQRHADRDRKA